MPPYIFWVLSYLCISGVAIGLGGVLSYGVASRRAARLPPVIAGAAGSVLALLGCAGTAAVVIFLITSACPAPQVPPTVKDIAGTWDTGHSGEPVMTLYDEHEAGGSFEISGIPGNWLGPYYSGIYSARGRWEITRHAGAYNVNMRFDQFEPRGPGRFGQFYRLCGEQPPYGIIGYTFHEDPDMGDEVVYRRR